MSKSAPEAHPTNLPTGKVELGRDYADNLSDPDETAQVPPQRTEQQNTAAEYIRRKPGRAARLARTAVVASMASELMGHARAPETPPEIRRLATILASQAVVRHLKRPPHSGIHGRLLY